jgi:hypothetical protein
MVMGRCMISGLFYLAFAAGLTVVASPLQAGELVVGAFSHARPSDNLPADWEMLTFPKIEKQTHYRLVHHQGRVVVQAQSQDAAAGLIRNLRLDLRQSPWLTWEWQIEHVLKKGDLRTKQGDDYAARVYVAFEFDPQRVNWWGRMTHAMASRSAGKELPGTMLTYIWANQASEGSVVNSPYTDQVKMVVLQSGNAKAGQWVTQHRNIVDDYVQAFGGPPPPAIGIVIMTDTDNTGESTTAFYGDISLSQIE